MGMVMIAVMTLVSPVFHDTLRIGKKSGGLVGTCTSSNPARCLQVWIVPQDSSLQKALSQGKDPGLMLRRLRDQAIRKAEQKGFTLTRVGPLPELDFSLLPRPANLMAFRGYEYPVETSQGTLYVATYYVDTVRDTLWPWPTTVVLQLHPVQDTLACFTSPYGDFCFYYFGHSHQENPQNLKDKPVGKFVPSVGDPADSIAVSTVPEPGCTSDCKAIGSIFYKGPEASGIVKLTADAGGLHAEGHGYIWLSLGGDVTQAPFLTYAVGGTCLHFGNLSPWKAGQRPYWDLRCGQTDENHFLLTEVVPLFDHILFLLADSLGWLQVEVDSSSQTCYVQPQWLFPINDASLPFGGMFDVCGTWDVNDGCTLAPEGGHHSHRTGRTVDLSTAYRIAYLTRQYVPNTRREREKIYSVLRNLSKQDNLESPLRGCFSPLRESNHVHLWLHPLGRAGRLDSTLVRAQEGSSCFQWVPW